MSGDSFYVLVGYVIPVVILLLTQAISHPLKYGVVNEVGRHVIPFVILVMAIDMVRSRGFVELQGLARIFILSAFWMLMVETIVRVGLSFMQVGVSLNFYAYKYNSLLYPDSNFTAINILVLMVFVDQSKKMSESMFSNSSWVLIRWILLAGLILTFSRTAYLIYALYFSFRLIVSYRKSVFKMLFSIALMLALVILIGPVYSAIVEDGSFLTKIDILSAAMDFVDGKFGSYMLGVGSGNLLDYIDRESHNIIGLMMEMGFIWLLILLLILVFLAFRGGKYTAWLAFPVVLSGVTALFPIAYLGFYFVACALLTAMAHAYDGGVYGE